MDDADKRQAQGEARHPQSRCHAGPAAQQHSAQEISQQWIGETHPGISWIFGMNIVAVDKAGDDLQVKRQIAKIVYQPGVDRAILYEECAGKNNGQQYSHRSIKEESMAVRMQRAARRAKYGLPIAWIEE